MVKMTLNKNEVDKMFRLSRKAENQAVNSAFRYFKRATPYKTGNARTQTRLKGNTIEADYSYAAVLDKGRHMTNRGMRGSKQAPEGMSTPSIEYFYAYLKKLLRSIR